MFYEWTNTIFEKLSSNSNFYKNNKALEVSHSGYEALSPLGSMLASSLGLSEVEFAKIKDKGKDYKEEYFSEVLPNGLEDLKKIEDTFNSYNMNTDFSRSKKRHNQGVLNKFYTLCLEMMEKRIQNQVEEEKIEDLEEYKKHQMFFLKKINTNFKRATRMNGSRLSRQVITHELAFCDDKISRVDLKQIAQEQINLTEFGFSKESMEKYNTAMVVKKNKFDRYVKIDNFNPQISSKEPNYTIPENSTRIGPSLDD